MRLKKKRKLAFIRSSFGSRGIIMNFETIVEHFQFEGHLQEVIPYGSGHINTTYLVVFSLPDQRQRRYILQKMNSGIFHNCAQLMENIANVTAFLRKKIIADSGDPERETVNIIPTTDGKTFYHSDVDGDWRAYIFIEDAKTYNMVQTPEDFYQTAVAFGHFQYLLSDYPADTLYETIPNFHHTPTRFEQFLNAVKMDCCGRTAKVQSEIDFVMQRKEDTHILTDLLAQNQIPLRVTHNDTKLNNIMIDDTTRKAICVIDLDTVMPGLSVYDFGDSIRFGASTAQEDETDLSKVHLDLQLFEQYTKGFLQGCQGSLTQIELDMLPMGAKIITLECGMRFLTDYLEGDHYFKIHREGHNLDRARTQFKLVEDMESKYHQMQQIVKLSQ